jgi:P27 family predicted phage terminase small subunit
MGARGPLPVPTPILRARGSVRASGRNGEPTPPVEAPDCPAWLTGEARATWERLVGELVAMGCIAKIDRTVLGMLCVAVGDYVRAVAYVAKVEAELSKAGTGMYDAEDEKTARWRRAARDARAASEQITKLAGHFGLSPATRPRLRVGDDAPRPGIPHRDRDKSRFFTDGAEPRLADFQD